MKHIIAGSIVGYIAGHLIVHLYEQHQFRKNVEVDTFTDYIPLSKREPAEVDEEIEPEEVFGYADEFVEFSDFKVEEEKEGGETKLKRGVDPNSKYAMETYIRSMIRDVNPQSHAVIYKLFDYEFAPTNVADGITYDVLVERRRDFFGSISKYSNMVSWADLILYYAERMDFDLDEGVGRWTDYILTQLDINSSTKDDDITYILHDVGNHKFINHETGLATMFALDDDGVVFVKNMISRTIAKEQTFEMEFNAFLNDQLGDD